MVLPGHLRENFAPFRKRLRLSLSRDPEADDMIRPRGSFLCGHVGRAADRLCRTERHRKRDRGNQKAMGGALARGLGFGRRLMGAAENAARNLSIKTVRLDTPCQRLSNFTAAPDGAR